MKNIVYILIFLVSLVLSGCNEELWQDNSVEQDGIKLTIYNSALTKATDSGEEYERKIETLDCFFYPKGMTNKGCVFHHHADVKNTTGRVDILINVLENVINDIFPVTTEKECDVFVIANLPAGVKPNDVVFAPDPNNLNTSLDALRKYVLQIADKDNPDFEPTYDTKNSTFVMTGLAIGTKTSKNNCTATVGLKRAASKATLKVAIPTHLEVDISETEKRMMVPIFTEDDGDVTLMASLQNGAAKSYLFNDNDKELDQSLFASDKYSFTYKETIKCKTDPSKDSLYVYECNSPFYTYARQWNKGAVDAAYMTFQMPWGEDNNNDGKAETNVKTYYYQILVNGTERCFEPNNWYDMYVRVGVIGSTIESVPMILDHLMLYVLDWTDQDADVHHPKHDVELDIYNYLSVQNPVIEMDNESIATIRFNASNTIEWEVTSAYTINNSGVSSVTENVNISKTGNFNYDKEDGTLQFIRTIPSNQYAPLYVTLNMWLDLDGEGDLDSNEEEFLREVKITQYPPMYVERDQSTLRSVYVNGARGTYNSTSGFSTTNLGANYPLGYTNGIRNYDSVSNEEKENGYGNYNNHQINYSMFIITVTSFAGDDEFTAPVMDTSGYFSSVGTGNYNNGSHTPPSQTDFAKKGYKYIIGDPRVRKPDDLRNLNPTPNQWVEDLALYDGDGNIAATDYKRRLANYYPAESSGEGFRVVAPKFRIVSFNNASGKECNHHSAAMRCASLQEDGFPAGRWRLPTIAEIQYIIQLQENNAIQPIFTSSGSFYATASYGDSGHTKRIAVAYNKTDKVLVWNNLSSRISVRCVYDEWYWGSTRDAIKNKDSNQWVEDYKHNRELSDEYLFTWGDKPITW